MAEEITILAGTKEEKYQSLIPQIKALVQDETDLVACLSNIMAALHQGMGFLWVGCYFVKEDELVLGPFQGPVACFRIGMGEGVCGKAWQQQQPIIVDDVGTFPGHIACSAESRSEIVLPGFNKKGEVALLLDVDSRQLSDFDETDQMYLQQVMHIIEQKM